MMLINDFRTWFPYAEFIVPAIVLALLPVIGLRNRLQLHFSAQLGKAREVSRKIFFPRADYDNLLHFLVGQELRHKPAGNSPAQGNPVLRVYFKQVLRAPFVTPANRFPSPEAKITAIAILKN